MKITTRCFVKEIKDCLPNFTDSTESTGEKGQGDKFLATHSISSFLGRLCTPRAKSFWCVSFPPKEASRMLGNLETRGSLPSAPSTVHCTPSDLSCAVTPGLASPRAGWGGVFVCRDVCGSPLKKGFPGQIGLGMAETIDEHIHSYEKEQFHFVLIQCSPKLFDHRTFFLP